MRATLRPFRRIQDDEPVVDVDAAALNAARLEEARRVPHWHEVAEPVRRGRFLVDAASDALYRRYAGSIWVRGRVRPFLMRRNVDAQQEASRPTGRISAIEEGRTSDIETLRSETEERIRASRDENVVGRLLGGIALALGLALTTAANLI